ncbi:hypothetical protein B0A48_07028 [Cryoendolithus antarcticus]|uniref:6,7-dimethyl-8-ribityllumazine synthase n=1 Tax=Cryoendolithus antarcticus TaxID=1507870 RepID=A0A1V8T7V3_9PEZI|nr:hypothetical protein B0A48_07028 [Cryoendolithus antarcticus]
MSTTNAPLKGPGATPSYDGKPLRIGIIHARWNTTLIDALLAGTLKSLHAAGVQNNNIEIQSVPGSYELPFGAQQMIRASVTQHAAGSVGGVLAAVGEKAGDLLGGSVTDLTSLPKSTPATAAKSTGLTGPFDAVIAIGALIKGSTMHFEYISDAVSHGLMKVQLDTGCPVVFGLLTLLTEEQGLERAGLKEGGHNHGEDWGSAAVELGVKRKGWEQGQYVQ